MALENYIIGASNAGAAGYHNAMAGYDQRKREAEADRHNAFNRQNVDRQYKDQRMKEAFEQAALAYNEQDPSAALGLLNGVSRELDVAEPIPEQILPALKTRNMQLMQSGDANYGLVPSTIVETLPDGTTREVDVQFSSAGGYRPIGAKVQPNLVQGKLGDRIAWFDRRTGQPVSEVAMGVSPDQQPSLKGEQQAAIERAKTEAIPERSAAETAAAVDKAKAERQAVAQSDLPKLADKANYAISVIDGLLNHPGLTKIVGAASLLPIVPGTEQAGADAYMKQIEGQAFLEAFEALKGGGQITQIEGEKATQAILRLSRKQSLEDFKSSMNELKDIVTKAKQRAEKSAGVSRESLSVGTVEDGYVYVGGDPADEQSWVKQR